MFCLFVATVISLADPVTELLDFPTKELHAATLAQTKSGALVLACYAGTEEGHEDCRVWFRRFDGKKWSPAEQISDEERSYNPVLFQPRKEGAPLLLYYKAKGTPYTWKGYAKTSTDDGVTWSKPKPLPGSGDAYFEATGSRFVGPTKNKPLELPDGTLLLGSSMETKNKWYVHIERTKDYFLNFDKQGPFPVEGMSGLGPIQPAFLVHSPDYKSLQMITRVNVHGNSATSWSSDKGGSWTPIKYFDEEVGGSGIDAITLKDDKGHLIAGSLNYERRNAIGIWYSKDGKSWKRVQTLDKDNRVEYPSLLQTADGKVHIVYTHRRTRVRHTVFNVEDLLPKPDVK